uniref:Type I restriction modification DNA specificity domain-containing protein n=1 Tax=Candidatus Kentrum sp. DK TaxID=2126562 RepID=A0A450S5C8_9GAMM|nr:MAG: Type I restriction modification DNA specificity domain-containing protein [Candidatus Kentron sp. DK]
MNTQPYRTGAGTGARIGECVDVLPGYALKSCARHDPAGSHQVILGKHLPALGIGYRYHPKHELRITPKGKTVNYLVKTGDILFVSRGARNQAVLVEAAPERTIASATFYLLRTRGDVDGAYLAWFLNQTIAQDRIRQVRTGAGTPIVQRHAFADIVIPLPPPDIQRTIARLGACMARERILRQTLMECTAQLHTLIGRRLICHNGNE